MTDRQTLVDINRASLEELISISGIGGNLAQRIVDDRPYKTLHDLVRVVGINEKKLAALMPYLTLTSPGQRKKITQKQAPQRDEEAIGPVTKLGATEAFVFLEDRNERQDALLMIFGGFILGLIILLLRRASK